MRIRTICTKRIRRRLAERNQALDLDEARPTGRRRPAGRLSWPLLFSASSIYRGLRLPVRGGWPFRAASSSRSLLSHEPIRRAGDRARRAVDFYSKGLARLEGRWAGQGVEGSNISTSSTLTPPISTFSARARSSSDCARPGRGPARRRWPRGCSSPAPPATIRERQRAVSELRPRLDLREDLELLGVEVRGGIDPAALAAWGQRQREFPGKTVLVVATILGVLGTAAVCRLAVSGHAGLLPILVVLVLDAAFCALVSRPTFEPCWPPSIGGRTTSSCSRSCCAASNARHSSRRS